MKESGSRAPCASAAHNVGGVIEPGPRTLLQPVGSGEVLDGLRRALDGGPPIAPLSSDPAEKAQSLAMLRIEEQVAEPDAAAVVSTSGSTGRPKGVVLSRAAIRASASLTHARLGGVGDWALALPVHYVAGLMVLARTIVAGTGAHLVRADLADLPTVMPRMTGCRYLALVPTQLIRAFARPETVAALTGFDAVLVGGAALEADARRQAAELGIKVVETYGMSETCGGCVYDGVPLDGVAIDLETGTGRIMIISPTIFSGYRLRPDLTSEVVQNCAFRTWDRGRWSADARLEILGRLDGAVITGGFVVDLDEVERAARRWPLLGTANLAVIAVPHAERGLMIIAATDSTESLDQLRNFLASELPSYALPRRLVHLNVMPRTAGGKIDRMRLARALASAQPHDARAAPGVSDLLRAGQ
jgi:o-succinylbenzoate---CoA ligase